jgi:hypothetical protein
MEKFCPACLILYPLHSPRLDGPLKMSSWPSSKSPVCQGVKQQSRVPQIFNKGTNTPEAVFLVMSDPSMNEL